MTSLRYMQQDSKKSRYMQRAAWVAFSRSGIPVDKP